MASLSPQQPNAVHAPKNWMSAPPYSGKIPMVRGKAQISPKCADTKKAVMSVRTVFVVVRRSWIICIYDCNFLGAAIAKWDVAVQPHGIIGMVVRFV